MKLQYDILSIVFEYSIQDYMVKLFNWTFLSSVINICLRGANLNVIWFCRLCVDKYNENITECLNQGQQMQRVMYAKKTK